MSRLPAIPTRVTAPPGLSWSVENGLPKPPELFQTQQESSLTPTTPVRVGLSGSDEASPTTRSALGHVIAVGASATVENPG